MIKAAIASVVAGEELDAGEMERVMDVFLAGSATAAQMAAFLVALRMRGETPAELAAAARVMRRHCVRVSVAPTRVLVDTCGTGGDGANTFNISTAAAIVVAACGVPVAKHGNRAASSSSGSADVLEALGVNIDLHASQVARCIDELGIGFMFARTHHPAMRHVAPVRGELGIRTLFNYLGPLSNPAGATHQIIGVPEPRMLETLAQVLGLLGSERAVVVHGHGGIDELAISGPSRVAKLEHGAVTLGEVRPEDFGIATQPGADLRGGDAQANALMIRELLGGRPGPRRDAVVVNAAAALHVAGEAGALREAAALASSALDSGAALRKLDAWVALSRAV